MNEILIDCEALTLSELRAAWEAPVNVRVGEAAAKRVAAAQEKIAQLVAGGETVYGVNTGFGQLAQVRISDDELRHLQENLVRSHVPANANGRRSQPSLSSGRWSSAPRSVRNATG